MNAPLATLWDYLVQQLSYYNTQVVLYGVSLLGASAGMVGTFAVLRRRALTGDAVAHAALPGVCIAFLLWGERNLTVMLTGALVSGVLGMVTISALTRFTRIREDSAIGTVLSVFPGLGFVLSQMIQKQKFGMTGSKAGLDSFILGKTAGMTLGDAHLILVVAVICLVIVYLLYKELKVVAFDTGFAASLGWPVYWLDLLLMTLVSVAVVIGLPAVGVVLSAALLILPGASARFWTDRLGTMLVLAALFGGLTGFVGTLLSATLDTLPAGPIIVLTGTSFFFVSLLFGSKHGAVAHWWKQRGLSQKLAEKNFLAVAWQLQEGKKSLTIRSWQTRKAWSSSEVSHLVSRALKTGLVRATGGDEVELTPLGLEKALAAAREMRLWEKFLLEFPELASSVGTLAGKTVAEQISPAVAEQLTTQLKVAGSWPGQSLVNSLGSAS